MDDTSTQTSPSSQSSVSSDHNAPLTLHHAPRFGRVIPNRIFVGGIDIKTNESDLRCFFSQHGAVKEVKIVIDRAGVSKGYGFVTFETQEDAQNILKEADRLFFRDKRLNIGQAIRKQQVGMHCGFAVPNLNPAMAIPAPCNTMYLTTPTGYPYTYHNGVAYFHPPEMTTSASHWPSRSMSGSPVMVAHPAPPVYPQPAYHHAYQAPAQCVPTTLQWNIPQSPVPSSPVLYVQPSDLRYQPVEMPADGGCIQTSIPLTEASMPEQTHMDHMVQPAYHQLYLHNPAGMGPIMMHQETGKEQRFHPTRRGFPHSPINLKGRCSRGPHYTHLRKDHAAELAELSASQATEPLG
ncbi:protein boule-like isoform X2 [Clupea harengus]|uniref:Protein boule-like n=1 Tax=Clupea harengus TaxID=7950 RepID=A0A6P3WE87_CLUHA|nr:protein boule-like isoform X2 [Clupea harengus]